MRYAIYYTPNRDDPLTHAAAKWLGRNPYDAMATNIKGSFEEVVAAPRKYGFHGTLKAPFRLADSVNENDLLERFYQFQDELEAFDVPPLRLDQLGPFFALVPSTACVALDALAANAVEVFEPFRAPLTDAELAKRKPDQLSAPQKKHLERWGYPYVFDEFRFHLTLTGPVAQEHALSVRQALEEQFAPFIDRPLRIDNCALFVEPELGAPFYIYASKKVAA